MTRQWEMMRQKAGAMSWRMRASHKPITWMRAWPRMIGRGSVRLLPASSAHKLPMLSLARRIAKCRTRTWRIKDLRRSTLDHLSQHRQSRASTTSASRLPHLDRNRYHPAVLMISILTLHQLRIKELTNRAFKASILVQIRCPSKLRTPARRVIENPMWTLTLKKR